MEKNNVQQQQKNRQQNRGPGFREDITYFPSVQFHTKLSCEM